SGDVPAGPCQTCNQTTANRVPCQYKNDWDDPGGLLYRRGRACVSYNDVNVKANKLGCDLGDSVGISLRPAIFHGHGTTINPAKLSQSLNEGVGPWPPN